MKKPQKPHSEYPLTPHNSGKWCKKINGRLYYFGKWDDPVGALREYENAIADPQFLIVHAVTLMDLCNAFMTYKKHQASAGEIRESTWGEYDRVCKHLMAILGKSIELASLKPQQFEYLRKELAKLYPNPVTLRNILVKTRQLLKYAHGGGHTEYPLPFDFALKLPAARVIRKQKLGTDKILYSQKDITALIQHATGFMKPAIHLGINAGLGNRDVCELRWSDLDGEYLDHVRQKAATRRRAWLWPETRESLSRWKSVSPDSEYVCCGERGQKLAAGDNTPIAHLFEPIRQAAGVQGGFYDLRHTYRTEVDGVRDDAAVMLTMGHADQTINSAYRHKIELERLRKVGEYIRNWFIGKTE